MNSDFKLAVDIRDAVENLNLTLRSAARQGLAVAAHFEMESIDMEYPPQSGTKTYPSIQLEIDKIVRVL